MAFGLFLTESLNGDAVIILVSTVHRCPSNFGHIHNSNSAVDRAVERGLGRGGVVGSEPSWMLGTDSHELHFLPCNLNYTSRLTDNFNSCRPEACCRNIYSWSLHLLQENCCVTWDLPRIHISKSKPPCMSVWLKNPLRERRIHLNWCSSEQIKPLSIETLNEFRYIDDNICSRDQVLTTFSRYLDVGGVRVTWTLKWAVYLRET